MSPFAIALTCWFEERISNPVHFNSPALESPYFLMTFPLAGQINVPLSFSNPRSLFFCCSSLISCSAFCCDFPSCFAWSFAFLISSSSCFCLFSSIIFWLSAIAFSSFFSVFFRFISVCSSFLIDLFIASSVSVVFLLFTLNWSATTLCSFIVFWRILLLFTSSSWVVCICTLNSSRFFTIPVRAIDMYW